MKAPALDPQAFALIEATAQESAVGHNPRPIQTSAQCDAGNYKLGRVELHGLKIGIENPRGSYRTGIDKSGMRWTQRLAAHYGHFTGTSSISTWAVPLTSTNACSPSRTKSPPETLT